IGFLNGRLLALGRDLQHLLEPSGGRPDASTGWALFDRGSLVAARCERPEAERLAAVLLGSLSNGGRLEAAFRRQLPGFRVLELGSEPELARDGSKLLEHAWDLAAK